MSDREGAGRKSRKEQKVCLITAPRTALAKHRSSRPRKRRNPVDSDVSDPEQTSENGSGRRGTQPVDRSA